MLKPILHPLLKPVLEKGILSTGRKKTAFNPVKHFKTDTLWHFGTPDDWWQAFQRALGPELATAQTVNGIAIGGPAFTEYPIGPVTAGKVYRVRFRVTGYAGAGTMALAGSAGAQWTTWPLAVSGNGVSDQVITALSTFTAAVFTRDTNTATFTDVSVREIDLSKIQLWQDPAGTLPVTGPGQTWGLLLDAKYGLARGVELRGGFSAALIGSATPATYDTSTGIGAVTRVDGSNQSYVRLTGLLSNSLFYVRVTNTGASSIVIRQAALTVLVQSVAPGATAALFASTASSTEIDIAGNANGVTSTFTVESVREIPGYHASQPGATSRPKFTCQYNQLISNGNLATQTVTGIVNTGTWRLHLEGTGSVTLSGGATGVYAAGDHTITITTTSLTLTVSGTVTSGDLRRSIDVGIGKPYQWVNSATDMDTEGFPFYSQTDGVDDWASTPIIPLGTMGVSAITIANGVTKLSDAARAMLMEHGNAPPSNTYQLNVPMSGAIAYRFASSGTVLVAADVAGAAYPAPHKASLISEGDITNDIARLTVNNDTPVLSSADQGTGTYTDQILYLFRRGGTSLPFGGRWHGSTAVKRLCTDSENRRLKAYYNRNVKGY